MNPFKVVLAEIVHRPVSALLTAGICAVALTAVVSTVGLADFLTQQTKMIQRDAGLNIRILPASSDLGRYWTDGYADGSFDASLMQRIEDQDVANRLIPILQQRIEWGTSQAILTGIGQESFSRGKKKKAVYAGPQSKPDADPQQLVLGAVAASSRELTDGDAVELLGESFTVHRILAAEGTLDDSRVHASLATVQRLLGMPGKLNEIRALECNCEVPTDDPEQELRRALGDLLPGTQIIRHDRLADARRKQRQLAHRFANVVSPLMIVLAMTGVFALTLMNTNERRNEFGLYTTLGRGAMWIACVSTGRAALLGLAGGVLGGLLGGYVLNLVCASPELLGTQWELKGKVPSSAGQWLWISAGAGALIGALAALMPAWAAARRQPAGVLVEH